MSQKPTPGAMKATRMIAKHLDLKLYQKQLIINVASIIDKETSAPELLQACYKACEQLDEWGRGENRENVEANNAEIYRVVRAAIAKAEGEEQ